jgi:hypothetical protein
MSFLLRIFKKIEYASGYSNSLLPNLNQNYNTPPPPPPPPPTILLNGSCGLGLGYRDFPGGGGGGGDFSKHNTVHTILTTVCEH